MKPSRNLALLGLIISMTASLIAQQSPSRPLPPESRQFDFWIGEWEVTAPDGKPAGSSRIELIAGGAGLLENWSDADGSSGKSLNAYNAGTKQWQQYWIGSDGGVLELAGALTADSMVLTGEHEVRGRRLIDRITWTPKADGSVRQHWEQSTDGGKTWVTAFDGRYRKKKQV